jgi:signal transduction histidine kinase
MFRHAGRRLAILNAVVVILLIAGIGTLTYFTLRRNLEREVDRSLEERVAAASSGSLSVEVFGTVAPIAAAEAEDDEGEESEEEDEEEEHEDREIVSSGDTILLLIAPTGEIIQNPRGIDLPDVPVTPGFEAALDGSTDLRSFTLSDGERMRVMSAPVYRDGEIAGVIQALRSLNEYEDQLEIVRNMTLLGVGLGVLVAAPAGYYLSRRAMVPINAAFERQRAFVADASHELRTPLTLIRANAEYARRRPERPVSDALPSIDGIIREVDRMAALVDDLLTLARLDAGRLELSLKTENLASIAEAAMESMRPLADERGVQLTVEKGDDASAQVDGSRMEQVVRILLDNSIRHTPQGGEVTARVFRSGGASLVEVRDTGAGIDSRALPQVFERFSRQDDARGRAGGAGLGLSIARGLVEQHGGTIEISSKLGEGTVVTVRLPAGQDESPSVEP